MSLTKIETSIVESCGSIQRSQSYKEWSAGQQLQPGDLVLFNNSFAHRADAKVPKSEKYLAFEVDKGGGLSTTPKVGRGIRLNASFKRLNTQQRASVSTAALKQSLKIELAGLGVLVFSLIGKIGDTAKDSVKLNRGAFNSVELDSSLGNAVEVKGKKLRVGSTFDEELVWNSVSKNFTAAKRGAELCHDLRMEIGKALDKLESQASAKLTIPGPHSQVDIDSTLIGSITKVLKKDLAEYQKAMSECGGKPDKSSRAFNEVLRIAYNFSSDAGTFIRLLISTCDLNPVVLWGTMDGHLKLSQSLRELPWQRSRDKPSWKNYAYLIGDARNKAFHQLFPIDKSLILSIPGASLQDVNLRIFSEFTKKKDNKLTFADKGMADMLAEFTRTPNRRIPPSFWSKNETVMKSAIELLEETADHLVQLLPHSPKH